MQLICSCARSARRQLNAAVRSSDQTRTQGDAPWWNEELAVAKEALSSALNECPRRPDEVVRTRGIFRRLKNYRKGVYYQQQQMEQIEKYFSSEQKDFWKAFKDGKPQTCPLNDTDGWTSHFTTILAGQEASTNSNSILSLADLATKGTMLSTFSKDPQCLESLNDPITETDVVTALKGLSRNKAADAMGMTAECLTEATKDIPLDNGTMAKEYILAPILTVIYNQLFHHSGQYPQQFRINTLTPILKPNKCSSDHNNYRGIAVGSVLGKVYERILNTRANLLMEQHGLRSPTQCGFRPKYGTLDAMFTLKHAIDLHKHKKQLLYCLFVDFEKAFDMVPRAELINRCRQLGMRGCFLNAVISMYESILMVVKVNGKLGTPIHTVCGTKQGGELSPLLFGIFIEQLHELLSLHGPDLGVVIGNQRVPALMYADDVNGLLLAPEDVQCFLDILHTFCRLFGMKVNTSKTFIVIYRNPGQYIPSHTKRFLSGQSQWMYDGSPINIVAQFKYLGCIFHQSKGSSANTAALASAGTRAMHALLSQCRKAHINQSDFMLRMFNVLVEPVLSYGCQIWAPDLFLTQSSGDGWRTILEQPQEKVQLDFIRIIAKLPRCASRWILLHEFGAFPLHIHWLSLCARFWSKTLSGQDNRITQQAMHDNIRLYLDGCSDCWSARFLKAMMVVGVVSQASLHDANTVELVSQMHITEQDVLDKARMFIFKHVWDHHIPRDPAIAPTDMVVLSTYRYWVLSPSQRTNHTNTGAPHLKCFLSSKERAMLTRLRIGSFDLHVHTGRYDKKARNSRICVACNTGQVEDLRHFLCTCPAYAYIRQRYHHIFNAPNNALMPFMVLNHQNQRLLAKCIDEMFSLRYELMTVRTRCPSLANALVREQAPVDMLDMFEDSDTE